MAQKTPIVCIEPDLLHFLLYMGWLCVTGYLTSLYSSLMAFYEKDLKNILAYSTMSQSALVMSMISTNLKDLMLMHIIKHALGKTLSLMSISIFTIFMFGNQESRLLHATESLLPVHNTSVLCLFIMCGVQFPSSYYSKEYNLLFSMKEESVMSLIVLMVFMPFAYSVPLAYLLLRSYNNNTISSKMLYLSMCMKPLLLGLALFNGWSFTTNYSPPINKTWMNNKNFTLILPVIMLSLLYVWIRKQMANNNDMLYSLFNGLFLSTKRIISNKIKPINLSFSMNMLSFNNSSLILCLLSIILLMFIMSFLPFY